MSTKTEAETPPASHEDKPLDSMTTAEIVARWPKPLSKPLKKYSTEELLAFKNFGPATIGGALYVAAQAASRDTADARFGPAILSKGFTAVPFVSHEGLPDEAA